jgi:hypothetical protein
MSFYLMNYGRMEFLIEISNKKKTTVTVGDFAWFDVWECCSKIPDASNLVK